MQTLNEERQPTPSHSLPPPSSIVGFLRQAIFFYLRPYWGHYGIIFCTVLLSVGFEVSLNLSYTPLIDDAIPNHDGRKLILVLSGVLVMFVLSSGGDLLREYLGARLGTLLLSDLRLRLFRHLQELPASFFGRARAGDIVNRFSNDLNAIETALSYSLPNGIFAALQVVVNTTLMFLLDWRLAFLMMAVLPLTLGLPQALTGRANRTSYQRKQDDGAVSGMVQENIEAQAVIRAFGVHGFVTASFSRRLARLSPNVFAAAFSQRLVTRTTDIGYWLIYLVVMALGAYQAFIGQLTVGMYMSFVSIMIMAGTASTALASFCAELIPAVASQRRIDELLNEPPGPLPAPNSIALPPFHREIRFEEVCFSYAGPSGEANLRQASFSIPVGQSVAFVGRSGAGKSTVLNLLMRFYDPDEGRVLIDGHDIRQVAPASLRSQLGVVLQDTFLFNTTIRENIRLSKPEATDPEVEAAARAAEIHEFIMSLPLGYDTPVGERGGRLSGGERQRIALARALLHAPAILLLDEATSALDSETEGAINATLQKLATGRDRTILTVSHRLALAAAADQILVMDQGRIAERGSHQELLDRQGLYYQLWQRQNGFLVSAGGRQAKVTGPRLRAISLFGNLDDATLETIAGEFRAERHEADEALVSEGQRANRFYILVRGKVSLSAVNGGSKPVPVILEDGDCFGEIGLLDDIPQPYTARTLLPGFFLTLDREDFQRMMERIPALREALEQRAVDRNGRWASVPGAGK